MHSKNLKQRQQDPWNEQAHSTSAHRTHSKRSQSEKLTLSGNQKHQSRLPEKATILQKIQTEPKILSNNVLRTPNTHQNWTFLKPEKQADKAFLLLEDRQRQQRQCMGHQLDQHNKLAKSTLGANWKSITEAQAGQGHSIMLPAFLENSTLVVPALVPYVQ